MRLKDPPRTENLEGADMDAVNDWNAKVIEEFRANEGRLSGQFEGAPVLLLHTTGEPAVEAGFSMGRLVYHGAVYFIFRG